MVASPLDTASRSERAIVDLWKTLRPDDAYAQGLEECAGRFFSPTPANVRRALARIERLRASARDPMERKFLASLRARLTLPEPSAAPENLLEAFIRCRVKEGGREHLAALADSGRRALSATLARYGTREWAPGMRALVLIACAALRDFLDVLEADARDPRTLAAFADLRRAVSRYEGAFPLDGFPTAGTYGEIRASFRRHGAELGRARHYAKALRELWDYRETPAQVEAAGLRMLRREFPRFRAATERLAAELGCNPTAEAVDEALRAARGLPGDRIVPFLRALRDATQPVADRHLVAINPGYTVDIRETIPYMANTAWSLDTLTARPKELFLVSSMDPQNPRPTPAELLNLLVHEEYGHCVNGSNAAHAYRTQPRILDVLTGSFDSTSEGLAFQMEIEFLPILEGIAAGALRGREDVAFADFLASYGGVERIARDYEFLVLQWRILRFLRVIGDARINAGKQDIVDFVDWAHGRTGLSPSLVYHAVFPGHQVLGPGYASTYAIIGDRIASIRDEALRRGKSLRDFYGYATSLGWPARSVFEARLAAWAKT